MTLLYTLDFWNLDSWLLKSWNTNISYVKYAISFLGTKYTIKIWALIEPKIWVCVYDVIIYPWFLKSWLLTFEILKHEYLIYEECNLVFRYKIHYKNMSSDWAKNLGMCSWRYYVVLIFEILKHEYWTWHQTIWAAALKMAALRSRIYSFLRHRLLPSPSISHLWIMQPRF